ncbi:MAG: metal ABC transporter permease [Mariprofundaceae bacterium]
MILSFFNSEVMQAALLPSLLTAFVASSVSIMIMAHRLSFLAVGVSHASLAGAGVAVALSLPLLPVAGGIAIAVALLLAWMPRRRGIGEDAGTGILFSGSMALGILLISTAEQYRLDLFGLLFGNILTVSESDFQWLMAGSAIILFALLFSARCWWSIAFDAVTVAAEGVSVISYRLLLYAVIGLTVVLCVKLAGVVLTTGLLVLPGATAWFWGRTLFGLWSISVVTALLGTLVGLMFSYYWDWPSGATVVLTLCLIFATSGGAAWLLQQNRKHV